MLVYVIKFSPKIVLNILNFKLIIFLSNTYRPEAFELVAPVVERSAVNRWEWRDSPYKDRLQYDIANLQQQPEVCKYIYIYSMKCI